MSLNEALAHTSEQFSAYGLMSCRETGALYGCVLFPADDLSASVTREGVPYGLALSFNKHDALTDIELRYSRRVSGGEGVHLSRAECRSIYERTLMWVGQEYGHIAQGQEPEQGEVLHRSEDGMSYRSYDVGDSLIARHGAEKSGGRAVSTMVTYIVTDGAPSCLVTVRLSDDPSVERWELPPDERRAYEKIVD